MNLQLGSSGFNVTKLQHALRNIYRFTPVTGVFDDTTLGIVRRYVSEHNCGKLENDCVDSSLFEAIMRELPGTGSGSFSVSGSVDSPTLLKDMGLLGYSVASTSAIHVALPGSDRVGADVVKFAEGLNPAIRHDLNELNSCLVVVVNTEVDAVVFASLGVRAPIRVVHRVAPQVKFVGIQEGSPTLGYYGNCPASVDKVFSETFNGHYDNLSLVVSEKFTSKDCRVVGIPAVTIRDWVTPLSGVITDGSSGIELCVASLGKPVIVPKISFPRHHGFDESSAILVDNSSYSGDHVIGIPHSRSGLAAAMRACVDAAQNVNSPVHRIGIGAATFAKSLSSARAARDLAKVLDEIMKSRARE